jgi:hypothetical protein
VYGLVALDALDGFIWFSGQWSAAQGQEPVLANRKTPSVHSLSGHIELEIVTLRTVVLAFLVLVMA